MNIYTYSKARQNLASLLEKAKKGSKILIKRKDGAMFELKAVRTKTSPLDVKGINLDITREEINSVIREVRERN